MEVMELIQIKTHLPAVNNCLLEVFYFPFALIWRTFFKKEKNF